MLYGIAGPAEHVVVEKKFKIEFTVEPEFMRDLERARSLLPTKHPKRIGLEQLFGVFLKEYLDRHSPESRIKKREQRRENRKKRDIKKKKNTRNTKQAKERDPEGEKIGGNSERGGQIGTGESLKKQKAPPPTTTRKKPAAARTRHIPQHIRDEVFVRDGGSCTFVSTDGKRCEEIRNLEIDHIVPYAKGGSNSPENLRLLCAKHNRLEAERAYGEKFMDSYYRTE